MPELKTSITITVKSPTADNEHLSVELDEVMNEGKTEFGPDDDVYLLVYTYPFDMALITDVSDGSLQEVGIVTLEKEDYVCFEPKSNEAEVSYPVLNILSFKWLGVDGGNVSAVGTKVIRENTGRVAVAKLEWQTKARRYKLVLPAHLRTEQFDEYQILVFFAKDENA